jgi:hypothetical protein
MIKQVLIALDQLINTLIFTGKDGFGMADETMSARLWRLQNNSKVWLMARRLVDVVALVLFRDRNHCHKAYIAEFEKHQLPDEYRGLTPK